MKETLILLVPATVTVVTSVLLWRRAFPGISGVLEPGVLCSVHDGEGWFRVVKVLAVEKESVHLRLYANRWKSRPSLRMLKGVELYMGCIRDKNAELSRPHLPLSRQSFADWHPLPLRKAPLLAFELEGYECWKEIGGKIFEE
ncbi:MAG: hypothetical protein V4710_03625 [Verrucomicrobiota bacterium]